MTNLRKISYEDNAQLDAQGGLRTSQQRIVLEDKRVAVDSNVGNLATGSAAVAFQANAARFRLRVNGAGGKAIRQSRQRATYQLGDTQHIQVGFQGYVLNAAVTSRVGYFDESNGLFLQAVGTDLSFVIRSFVTGVAVDTVIARSSWLDTLDGTGGTSNPSGVTLDFTQTNVLVIDFQWPGRIRFGFVINGRTLIAYEEYWTNANQGNFMSNPNLPLRWEIETTADLTRDLFALAASVANEGGPTHRGRILGFGTGRGIEAAIGGAEEEMIALRLRSGGTPAGYTSGIAFVKSIDVMCTSNSNFIWRLRLNPTGPTGGSWLNENASIVERNWGRTGAPTDGIIIATGFGTVATDAVTIPVTDLQGLGYDIATSEADIYSLTVQTVTGTADENYSAAINVIEVT